MNHTTTIKKQPSLKYELVKQILGKYIFKVTLFNNDVSVTITNIGCSIMEIITPDRDGIKKNIVTGFKSIDEYLDNKDYFGCVIGRYANRIAKGEFTLNGQLYQLPINSGDNHLHGGIEGFNKKIWSIENFIQTDNEAGVQLKYTSADGEEGYPGNLQVQTTYILNDKNQLQIQYEAVTDKTTPVNLTNHTYFNLSAFEQETIKDHLLQVNAKSYIEKTTSNVPTGKILQVNNTSLDFTSLKRIGDRINDFPLDHGYDHNFVLEKNQEKEMSFAGILKERVSGRVVKVYTTEPGMQVYTGNFFDGTVKGTQESYYQKHAAIALETQAFPDSSNHPDFPNTFLLPGQEYNSKTMYEFSVE